MGRKKDITAWVDIICKTCKKSFQSRRSRIKTYCNKTCSNKDPDIINKIKISTKKTYDAKYNGNHPMNTDSTKETLKKSLIKKYGVDHYSKHVSYREKVKSTMMKKYGNENYYNVQKMKNTCIEKYGVDNYTKSEEYKDKYIKTCLKKYGTTHYAKTKLFKEQHKQLMFEKFLNNNRFVNFTPKFTMEEYSGVTNKFNKKYSFECKRCKTISECFIHNGKTPKCDVCDVSSISGFQDEIYEFIKTELGIDCILNDRKTIYPKELDIYIPSKKIAIECNGIYWHSEVLGKKNKTYHINKTENCIKQGIHLIHIFENEWNNKKNIIKSILKNILNCNVDKIGARKCKIIEINKKISKQFLNDNHLQGNDHSSLKYGLYYKTELISIMTFCKSRFDKKCEWELSRYCNKINLNIQGAASKLFSHFIKKHQPNNIVSYSDRKIFSGDIYFKLGFNFIQNTPPNYHYIIDNYSNLKHRMGFQKHKLNKLLSDFDVNLTEWENMKNHGFDRIWDCGHSKWLFTKT